ncbi:hypothetical protein FRB95_006540, partial [Tulasnella sp. JGI-2019a]
MISSDNTGNTRTTHANVVEKYPHILNAPNPCHHLHNTIKDLVALPEFRAATAELHMFQIEETGFTTTIETIGNTRFATIYWSGNSIRLVWSLLESFGSQLGIEEQFKGTGPNTKEGNKVVQLLLLKNIQKFCICLNTLLDIIRPLAKAIENLESQQVTVADVFLHWIAIFAILKNYLNTDKASVSPDIQDNTQDAIIAILNKQFCGMIEDGPLDIY